MDTYRLIGFSAIGEKELLQDWWKEMGVLAASWLLLATISAFLTGLVIRDQVRAAQMATTDPLTKLPNRRAFLNAAQNELLRAARHGHDTAFLLMDIDHFKQVNDTYGHDVGDLALQDVSRILEEACRSTDLPCRYGGEEFAMVLPETGRQGALSTAEKVRSLVEAATIDAGQRTLRITCSVGVSGYRGSDDSIESILKRADEALYEAKKKGRNQVREAP